jgi:transcriptional regulator with XRE-family HTH domain
METTNRSKEKVSKKRFSSVAEMVEAITEDQGFTDKVKEMIEERQLIKCLMTLRAMASLSQEGLAERMRCTQSRISKLENGVDFDLRLGDVCTYTESLGYEARLVISPRCATLADEVKYHAFAIKNLLDKIAAVSGEDRTIAQGAMGFFAETAYNLSRFIRGAITRICPHPLKRQSTMKVELQSCDSENKESAASLQVLYPEEVGGLQLQTQ